MLGVVSAYEPAWVADTMRWLVAAIATPVLIWAASTSMLGVSRHIYTLAINRQIPSWLGKLHRAHGDALRGDRAQRPDRVRARRPDQRQAAGRDLRLRRDPGDHHRPPLDHPPADHQAGQAAPVQDPAGRSPGGRRELPLPAIFAALVSGLAFISVLAYHSTARWVGLGWMAFGLTFYVVYRKVFEGTTLTKRVSVTERALTKQVPGDRIQQHPRPGLRDQVRRRHRRHRRAPGGGRGRRRRRAGTTRASTSST